MKRLAFAVVAILMGFFAGLVMTGRLHRAPAGEVAAAAQPGGGDQAAAPAGAGARAAAGLPDFTAVADRAVGAVTNISSAQVVRSSNSPFANDPFFRYFFGDDMDLFGGRDRREASLGSGVVVSSDGYILTNNHVVGSDTAEITVALADKRELRADLVGTDPYTDIALLKVRATGLPTIPWGDSSRLKVAEWVLAIGNPFQLNQTVTLGIVSAVGRANVGVAAYEDFIQTDAAINPGNSGGALINARGELVGINTAIYSQSGGYQGVGFAVPSNLARRVMTDLIRYGEVRRGSLGYLQVREMNESLAQQLGLPAAKGVLVERMARDSAAYDAGIRPGDVIVSFNRKSVEDSGQLLRLIADSPIGSSVTVGAYRDGRMIELKAQVGAMRQRTTARR
ncbi:MAG TPA: trypsin-like peptidase domain-containing protein [Vicinamibacterales bacterium]|nr:trypsin-like peptidase domain-containing protein [Vicinamibacterales bacterium]HPW21756.1 trypsin-like peptidase domain-containing protein [Vicinamibacterales bacterium]